MNMSNSCSHTIVGGIFLSTSSLALAGKSRGSFLFSSKSDGAQVWLNKKNVKHISSIKKNNDFFSLQVSCFKSKYKDIAGQSATVSSNFLSAGRPAHLLHL